MKTLLKQTATRTSFKTATTSLSKRSTFKNQFKEK